MVTVNVLSPLPELVITPPPDNDATSTAGEPSRSSVPAVIVRLPSASAAELVGLERAALNERAAAVLIRARRGSRRCRTANSA